MQRSYELTYILPANLNEIEQQETEEKVVGWINSAEGVITNTSHWGRRKLGYQISNNREGYYIFLEVDLDPSKLSDLNRRMTIEPTIIRHLFVRVEE